MGSKALELTGVLYIYIYLEVPKCNRESTETSKLR